MSFGTKTKFRISIFSETISSWYFNKYYLLNEAYNNLSLTRLNIQRSLETVYVDVLTSQDLSDKNILNHLNTEFLKVNIIFEKDNPSLKIKPAYPECGINRGENINGIIYLYVNDKFFELFKVDFDKGEFDFYQASQDIMTMYTHEYTHEHQYNNQAKHPDSIETDNAIDNQIKYLSNIYEIDAKAREFAAILKQTPMSQQDILNEINKGQKSEFITLDIFNIYFKLFGIHKNMLKVYPKGSKNYIREEQKVNVWNRFIRKTIDFFLLDKKSYFESNMFKE